MRLFRILIFVVLAVATCPVPNALSAESAEASADSIQVDYVLNPIVKTATKVGGAQRDLAASVSVLGEGDLSLAPTAAVLEVIQHRIPSLYTTEWGVMGFGVAGQAAGKISIRGMGGGANTHVLILRNGRPDFMGLMGCTIADEFTSDGVERIEIVRGPGSFLYGTNATGGVINIISKRIREDGFQTHMSGGYGTFDTRTLSLNHGGRQGGFDYFLTANHRQTDGHRMGSDYEAGHYTLHAGYRIDARTRLDVNANLADMVVNDPGPITSPKEDDWYDVLRLGGDVNLIHESRWGETQIKLHGNFGAHTFFDGWRSHDRTLGVMVYQNMKPWYGNTTTVGLDYKRYGGDAVDAVTDYGTFFITEYAPYIHVQQLFLGRLIASTGLRVEHHSLYGYEILPKVGLVAHLASSSLRFSVAKGFRSPSIRELYFWAPANDALTPDRLWNYEIGITQTIGNRWHLEAAVFRSEGSNLIQFSGPPPKWVNSGSYAHTGYEVLFKWFPTDDCELGGSWSDMDLSEGVFNIPEEKLTFYGSCRFWRFRLSGNLLMVRHLTGADFTGPTPVPQLVPMDDYAVLNVTLQFHAFSFLEARLAVKNVLDAEYQSMAGYPMPSRHMNLGLTYRM